MDTNKLVHLPPNVRELLAASQRVVEEYSQDDNDIDGAILNLKKSLGNFAIGDTRQPHTKDRRQKGPI